jgi:hypothetical protein
MMYKNAILGQDERGLHWLANTDTVEEARDQVNPEDLTFAGQQYDAILIVALAEFASL